MKLTNGYLLSLARRHFLAAASATASKVGVISASALSVIASDADAGDKKPKEPKGGKSRCLLKGTDISTSEGEARVS